MEQEDCDHLLGLDDYGNRIYDSYNEEYNIIDYFSYCPECGKKLINTTKIENVE